MNIADYKKLLPKLHQAGIVPFVWGKKGIGKTEIHRQLADTLGMEMIYLTFGAVEDVGDIIGLQNFHEENGVQKVHHVAPDWFPTTGNKLIIIDEFNRAKPQILQAMFPFILEGRLHTHKLPENCMIVAIGNPPTDDYDVTDISDNALLSRFCHIELTPTFKEWSTYVSDYEGADDVVGFFRDNQNYLSTKEPEFNIKTLTKPDFRNATSLIRFNGLGNVTDTEVRSVASGLIGPEVAVQFMAWRTDNRKRVNADDILKEYTKDVSKKVLKLESDRDLLNNTLESLLQKVKKKKVLKDDQIKNIELFLLDLPADLCVKGVQELICMSEQFISTIGESKKLLEKLKPYTKSEKS